MSICLKFPIIWNLKYDTNELIYEKEIHKHKEQTCGCQGREQVEEAWVGNLGLADANYYTGDG